jgi:hypothetical protein
MDLLFVEVKVQRWRHYQNKDPHEAAVEHCPNLVMPSPTCFTQCTEQPCFLVFMCFPVVPSGAASITGKKSSWASQKQNAHRSRTFHFWKAQQGFTLFVHLSLENLVLHSLLARVMPLWTLGYNIMICSWQPAGFHQSIFGFQCVAKTVEDNVTALKTFQIYYFVATFP